MEECSTELYAHRFQKLINLREALVALKGPLGNIPAFRNRLEQLLQDKEQREKLLSELDAVVSSQDENS